MVIATTNTNKINRLTKILSRIRPNMVLSDITKLNIEAPVEDGKTQHDNTKIKLSYYFKKLATDIIVEDDIIELVIGGESLPILSINKYLPAKENSFEAWKEYLSKNNVVRGRLIKEYGVMIKGKENYEKISIPLLVRTENVVENKKERNMLNNFIGPIETGKTYVEMTTEERDAYMEMMCAPVLNSLIQS